MQTVDALRQLDQHHTDDRDHTDDDQRDLCAAEHRHRRPRKSRPSSPGPSAPPAVTIV